MKRNLLTITSRPAYQLKSILGGLGIVLLGLLLSQQAGAEPKIKQWTMDNGAQVYFAPSPVLPMLDVYISFDAGARRDEKEKAGLSSMVAMMASKGILAGKHNEPALNENQITEAWLDLGANFQASSGRDDFSYSLRTLTYPEILPQAVALAARIIAQPSYPQDVLARDQARMVASLKESLTRPATIASRTYSGLVYGSHPYGQQSTQQSIQAVTAADLKAFHARYILPCRAKISMVGNITQEQAEQIAKQLLGNLPQAPTCPALAAVEEVPELKAAVDEHIAFDAAQAQIYIGQPGIKRSDADFITLVVANHILGGSGFSSRLMQEVRESRGLTYGVSSYFSPGAHAGAFTISLKTRPDQAQEAWQVSVDVLKEFVEKGPTTEELKAAKANLLGGFPLMFDSNAKLLAQVANIATNNLPLDYLERWPAMVEKITAEDIKVAMQKVIHTDKLVTVVLGAKEAAIK